MMIDKIETVLFSLFQHQMSYQNVSLTGMSSLWVPGVPWHPQILADHLTLYQPGGADYAHQITTGTPWFSDLPTALTHVDISLLGMTFNQRFVSSIGNIEKAP